jgi:hypothetical protein
LLLINIVVFHIFIQLYINIVYIKEKIL